MMIPKELFSLKIYFISEMVLFISAFFHSFSAFENRWMSRRIFKDENCFLAEGRTKKIYETILGDFTKNSY